MIIVIQNKLFIWYNVGFLVSSILVAQKLSFGQEQRNIKVSIESLWVINKHQCESYSKNVSMSITLLKVIPV